MNYIDHCFGKNLSAEQSFVRPRMRYTDVHYIKFSIGYLEMKWEEQGRIWFAGLVNGWVDFFGGYDQKIFVNPMMKGKMLGRSISFLTNNRFGFKKV